MNIPEVIINTIKQSDIKELAIENSEVIIDDLLDDGLLKDIPIIGNLFKVYSVSKSISNNIFIRKILRFFDELNNIPEKERIQFVDRLDANPKFRNEVGEKLMLSIEKLDDSKKAVFLAKAFSLYITEQIPYKDFLILSYMIDRFNLAYLAELVATFRYNIGGMPNEVYDHFINCGILQSNSARENEILYSRPRVYVANIGKIFAERIVASSDNEIKESFSEHILDVEISESIGDYEKDVQRFNSRHKAKEFLLSLDISHFNGSYIGGNQFIDKMENTRFRRTGIDDYEFINVSQK